MPSAYGDINFCLKIRKAGYRIVWTPDAELCRDEPLPDAYSNTPESKYFKNRWAKVLENDPYSNPNRTLR